MTRLVSSIYGADIAESYDSSSSYDKGDRDLHKDYLRSILRFLGAQPVEFIDFGGGTGYFSQAFFEENANSRGLLIDGSRQMIELAREKFSTSASGMSFVVEVLQEIDWNCLPPADIGFCALTSHFLDPAQKAVFFSGVYRTLKDAGILILMDQYRSACEYKNSLRDYLACSDIQRRLGGVIGVERGEEEFISGLGIDELSARDSRLRSDEDAFDMDVGAYRRLLKDVGFAGTAMLFQDARYFCMIGFKESYPTMVAAR